MFSYDQVMMGLFVTTFKLSKLMYVGFGLCVVFPGVALFHFMMISSLRMGITLPQNWPICPI